MSRILITGASGFVGKALCAALLQSGHDIRKAARIAGKEPCGGGSDMGSNDETVYVGDITPGTDWSRALDGIDTVIHLAARVHIMHDDARDPAAEFRRVNTAGTDHLARCAAAHGVKRLVYVSSIKVNGEETTGGRIYSEQDTPAPQDAYAVSKWEAEQALQRVAQETGMQIVVVRPPLVYGAEVKGNFAQMIAAVANGMPLPLASVCNRRDLLYVGNLVDALISCASRSEAAGQTYLLSDGEAVSTPELLRRLAHALGVAPRIFSFSPSLLVLAGKLLGRSAQVKRLLGSLEVDSGKIRSQLNWNPPYTLQQGLQATAEWYRKTRP